MNKGPRGQIFHISVSARAVPIIHPIYSSHLRSKLSLFCYLSPLSALLRSFLLFRLVGTRRLDQLRVHWQGPFTFLYSCISIHGSIFFLSFSRLPLTCRLQQRQLQLSIRLSCSIFLHFLVSSTRLLLFFFAHYFSSFFLACLFFLFVCVMR